MGDGNEMSLRLSDAIAEGMTPAELYAQISDLIDRVSMVSVPRYHRNVSDPSLWRVDPKGLFLRFSSEDPERLFILESLCLVWQAKSGIMRIEIDPRDAPALTTLCPVSK